METSRKTSLLLQHRAAHIVEPRLAEIENAFLQKDFNTFGRITMQDSNQFHAVCMDTYPPIFYMNDVSKSIIKLVHVFNEYFGEIRAAYTFDAGPNAVIYTLDKHVDSLLALVNLYFPTSDSTAESYCNRPADFLRVGATINEHLPEELVAKLATTGRIPKPDDVKFVFVTKVGPGPVNLPANESLLDPNTGNPVEPGPAHKRLKIGH
jgi:diphosphomevalonate decarboxylase